MKGKIPEKLYKACGGDDTWKNYGVRNREYGWQKFAEIDLEEISKKRLERLREMILPYTARIRGTKTLVRDIDTWLKVLNNEQTGIAPRTVEQFALLLTAYINGSPNHWLFEHDELSETWFGYYVGGITYHPPRRDYHNKDDIPPSVDVDLFYEEFGVRRKSSIAFFGEDCIDLSVPTALKRKGYVLAGEKLMKLYRDDVARYDSLVREVGLQLRGRGRATDDLDGNPKENGTEEGDLMANPHGIVHVLVSLVAELKEFAMNRWPVLEEDGERVHYGPWSDADQTADEWAEEVALGCAGRFRDSLVGCEDMDVEEATYGCGAIIMAHALLYRSNADDMTESEGQDIAYATVKRCRATVDPQPAK